MGGAKRNGRRGNSGGDVGIYCIRKNLFSINKIKPKPEIYFQVRNLSGSHPITL